MTRIAAGRGRPGRGWLFALAGLLLLWSCSDILNDPAPAGDLRPLSLRLSRSPTPGGPNASIADALEQADAARVRLQRGGSSEGVTVLDTVVAFTRDDNELRVRVTLDATLAGEPLLVLVQLLGGEAVLFEGSSTVTIEGSGTTSAEVAIEPVVAAVDAGEDPPPLTAIGAELQLTGTALFATGDEVPDVQLTWRALDAEVVEVSASGRVVAVANGQARVEGAFAGLTDTVVVRVAQAVASIVVAPAAARLQPGGTQQLTATASDANGNPAAGVEFVWSSSDSEVVTIGAETGLARAVAVGTASVSATVGEASGSASVAVDNPGPVLSSIDPARAVAGAGPLTVTAFGSGFVAASEVHWNGAARPTEFVSATELRVTIPASDLTAAGSAQVTVVNPAPGGGESAAVTFAIVHPGPVLSSIAPASAVAGSPALTLTASGSGFVAASVVHWNGAARPTEFVSATELRVSIPATDLAAPGSAQVTVVNPAPGGGESAAQTFTIAAAPRLVVNPTSIAFVTTRGGGDPAAQTVAVSNGGSGSLGPVTFEISYPSGSEFLRITPTSVTNAGTFTLTALAGQLAPGVYEAQVHFAAAGPAVILPVTLTIEETIPAPPTQLAARRVGLDVTLAWADNSDNETSFAIERATGEGSFGRIATVAANVQTFADPGVVWGQIYRYRVVAVNSAGESAPSNVVQVEVQDPPSADTQDAQDVTNGSVALHGTVAPSGLTFNYRFGWQTNSREYSDSTAWTSSGTCDPALACAVEEPLASLYGDTEYFYWIEVQNALGAVYGDTVIFRTLPPTQPTARTDRVTTDEDYSAVMYFTVSPNGEDFYSWVEVGFVPDFGEATYQSQPAFSSLRSRFGDADPWEIAVQLSLPGSVTLYWRPAVMDINENIFYGPVQAFTTTGDPGS